MIPGWVPRWHPFVWLIVIVMIYAVWTDPSMWGHRIGDLLGLIPELAHKAEILVQSI